MRVRLLQSHCQEERGREGADTCDLWVLARPSWDPMRINCSERRVCRSGVRVTLCEGVVSMKSRSHDPSATKQGLKLGCRVFSVCASEYACACIWHVFVLQ